MTWILYGTKRITLRHWVLQGFKILRAAGKSGTSRLIRIGILDPRESQNLLHVSLHAAAVTQIFGSVVSLVVVTSHLSIYKVY